MIRYQLIGAVLLLAPFQAHLAQAAPAGSSAAIVESYELDVRFVPAEGRMEATAIMAFEPLPAGLTALTFHLHGELKAESVSVGSDKLEFVQDSVPYENDYSMIARRVVVDLPEAGLAGSLTVKYGGHFSPSGARSPSDYMRIDDTGVYLRSIGYSPWFPIFSESEDYDVRASFPRVVLRTSAGFTAVFVGERVQNSESGEEWTAEWRAEDIPIFDAQCTAHRFSVHRQEDYFIYARQDERSRAMAPKIAGFARQITDLYGKNYRREGIARQVHVVQMPPFGDIASGNVVGITTDNWHGFEKNEWSQRTLAHEIVHAFVQVPTPPGDPLRAMVIEGFPSFFHHLALAELRGDEAAYEALMNRTMKAYLEKRATGKSRRGRALPPEKSLAAISEQEIGVYKDTFVLSDRALLFLDYLRRAMGKEEFKRFSRRLFNLEALSLEIFYDEILAHLPESREDVRLWLETSEFPDRFHRSPVTGHAEADMPGAPAAD